MNFFFCFHIKCINTFKLILWYKKIERTLLAITFSILNQVSVARLLELSRTFLFHVLFYLCHDYNSKTKKVSKSAFMMIQAF